MMTVVGAHAEGEIGRVVTGGVGKIPGKTMLERLEWLNHQGDGIRRFCLFEPRGAAQMSVNLLLPPCDPAADVAFIPMQGDRSHAMSGSNAICVVTTVLETGMLAMIEPETTVVLDTAAGLVTARASCRKGKVTAVSLDFVESFVEHLDHPLAVDGLGELRVDVAFGGVYYVLVDTAQVGVEITPTKARTLVDLGNRIGAAARERIAVRHPTVPEFDRIAFCMFTGVEAGGERHYRNATILPPGRVDRSPCGTGSAARLATMRARGLIGLGEYVTMRSIIGTRFTVGVQADTRLGTRAAIRPRIQGRAWLYAVSQLGVDPSDPFPEGFTMSDTWGDGVVHEIPVA